MIHDRRARDEQPHIERHHQCQEPQNQHNHPEDQGIAHARQVALLYRMRRLDRTVGAKQRRGQVGLIAMSGVIGGVYLFIGGSDGLCLLGYAFPLEGAQKVSVLALLGDL